MGLDPTKKFLIDQVGNPCFIQGDDISVLILNSGKAEIERYLADRASRGFNCVIWTFIDNVVPNANGDFPFTGPIFSAYNEVYWQYVDYAMQRCLAYGLTVIACIEFVGLDAARGFFDSFYNLPTATIQGYGTFLGNRYRNFKNIIWLVGGDADPTNAASYAALNVLGLALKAADPTKLITLEAVRDDNTGVNVTSYEACITAYGSLPSWVDINWLYPTAPTAGATAQRGYQQGGLPSLPGEDWFEDAHSTTPQIVRQEGYSCVLGGGTLGRQFGSRQIQAFGLAAAGANSPTSWIPQLSSVGTVGQQLLGKLFRSRAFHKLVPDKSNVVMTVGAGSYPTGSYCARTSDGQTIISYLPSSQTVTIDMSKITDAGSQAKCWWCDPTNGATTLIGTFANSSTRNFTTPGNNNAGDADRILVIDSNAAGLRTPGT